MTGPSIRFSPLYLAMLALFCAAPGMLAQTSSLVQPTAPALSADLAENASDLPAAPQPQTQSTSGADSQSAPAQTPLSQHDRAEQQLRQQEHQRIFGIVPNFNSTDIQDAAPLSPKQKFRLAFRSAIDPFEFFASGMVAGFGQATDNHAGYGQGAQGYFKRYGAAYADSADGVLWGNAIFPTLFHQDPRYFRRGSGKVWRRILYSVSTTVWTKNDNGTWGPNYSNVMGNLVSGGISNLYYPSEDRGVELTFSGAAIVTAEGALGALGVEFWPDISRKLFHKKDHIAPAPAPK